MLGFVIWAAVGLFFVLLSIYTFFAKKPAHFWANAEMFEVINVKKYNRAMAKLWFFAGVSFIILGIPLLAGQNSPWVFVSILGTVFWAVGLMAVYGGRC